MKTTGVSGIPTFGLLDFLGHPNEYVYVCRFAVFQDAFDFSGQSGASEPLLNDSSLPVRYHVFLRNSTFIVVPI